MPRGLGIRVAHQLGQNVDWQWFLGRNHGYAEAALHIFPCAVKNMEVVHGTTRSRIGVFYLVNEPSHQFFRSLDWASARGRLSPPSARWHDGGRGVSQAILADSIFQVHFQCT